MGTNTNQIATETNVNSKRYLSFFADNHCPTKSQIESIEFLQVNNSGTASTKYFGSHGTMAATGSSEKYHWINSAYVSNASLSSGSSGEQACKYNYKNSNYILTTINAKFVFNPGGNVTFSYNGLRSYSGIDAYIYAFSRISVSPAASKHCKAIITIGPQGGVSTSASSSTTPTYCTCTIAGNIVIHILDYNKNIIKSEQFSASSTTTSRTIEWDSPNTSTNYICICPASLSFTVKPATSGTYYAWFGFYASCSFTPYTSYYSASKCVQFNDIVEKATKTFTVYYGIWNNKGSNADLDSIEAFIGDSTNRNTGTWTQIGKKTLGSLNSTTTGTFTCTIPSTISLASTKYISFYCGKTKYNQNWYYILGGDSANIKNVTGWTSAGKVSSYNINPAISLHTQVLSSDAYKNNKCRSSSKAVLFKIE